MPKKEINKLIELKNEISELNNKLNDINKLLLKKIEYFQNICPHENIKKYIEHIPDDYIIYECPFCNFSVCSYEPIEKFENNLRNEKNES
jgi:hypothetical protein